MKYESYVRAKLWDDLNNSYRTFNIEDLDPVAMDCYLRVLSSYILRYGEDPICDELEARQNVIDNIDDVNCLVLYEYISYHNLGVLIATGDWSTIDGLFKRRWVDELSAIVVNDYIEMRRENE